MTYNVYKNVTKNPISKMNILGGKQKQGNVIMGDVYH